MTSKSEGGSHKTWILVLVGLFMLVVGLGIGFTIGIVLAEDILNNNKNEQIPSKEFNSQGKKIISCFVSRQYNIELFLCIYKGN